MTGFFEHQDRARRNTRLLVVFMAAGVIAMGAAIWSLGLALETWGRMYSPALALQASTLTTPRTLLWCIAATAALVGAASVVRVASLRGGGRQVAEMLGGRLVSGQPQDELDRRLLNVVEEMAIASGVPVPQVFVLADEEGINAFAAGLSLNDAVVAVTRGALEKLTRDELQGVIAHEFSHVLNGDMRLNLRLMGIVYGILCVGLLGRMMMRAGMRSSRRSKSGGIAVLGLAILVIGLVGELFGKLIKAAVSRQREFLADASAVQFTRNPLGIAGALKKIGGHGSGGRVYNARAEEASHFFFDDIHGRHAFLVARSMFATHPPLAARIARLDPSFRGELPEVIGGVAEPAVGAGNALVSPLATEPPANASEVVAQVGTASPDALVAGHALLEAIPPPLRMATESASSAVATVHALLLSADAPVRARQLEAIVSEFGASLARETERLASMAQPLPRRVQLALVELCAPPLHQLSAAHFAAFARTLARTIDADERISVFEVVVAHLLGEAASAQPKRQRALRSLKAVRDELGLLLSLLAHAGAVAAGDADRAFAAAQARLGDLPLELLPSSDRLLHGLSPALVALRSLRPALAARLVDACAHAVLADRRVTDDELALLRLVCVSLDCPLPAQLE